MSGQLIGPPDDGTPAMIEGTYIVLLGGGTLEGTFEMSRPPTTTRNAADEPARLLELISPAGFENYFRELGPLLAAADRDEAAIGEVVARHELDIDFSSIPVLAERHGLRLG
jgi:hypothetical protein